MCETIPEHRPSGRLKMCTKPLRKLHTHANWTIVRARHCHSHRSCDSSSIPSETEQDIVTRVARPVLLVHSKVSSSLTSASPARVVLHRSPLRLAKAFTLPHILRLLLVPELADAELAHALLEHGPLVLSIRSGT